MNKPSVNILIPCYNQEEYICQAVDSALMQTYTNLKVIICDDNSTDNTLQVLEKYNNDSRIEVHSNRNNLGRLKNYRKLLYELCDSEYAVNLDGDDYYLVDNFIEDSISEILSGDNIVFSVSNQHYGKYDKSNSFRSKRFKQITGVDFVFKFYGIATFTHLGSVYKVSAAKNVNFYTDHIISSDADSFLRLAFEGNVKVRSYKVGMWRKHEENESTESQIEKKYENVSVLISNLSSYVEKHYPQYNSKLPGWQRKIAVQYLFPMITRNMLAGNKVNRNYVWNKIKEKHLPHFLNWYFPIYTLKRSTQIIFRAILS